MMRCDERKEEFILLDSLIIVMLTIYFLIKP